ncbi:hypothetical protein [Halosimplex amylolyticum]|uniref:hypothetical protein n=1 Tax=Halosimplex amylolyticum TaxID=3396616 RepID=UPI003F576F4C
MRYVIFTNTPAHVHLYKHAVRTLDSDGHDVLVLARDDSCTVDLLEYYGIRHKVYGRRGETPWALAGQLPGHFVRILRHVRDFDPDRIFGMGGYAAPVGAVTNTPVVAIQDSEPHTLDYMMARPIVEAFVTPHTFRRDLGPKHFRVLGFKESAYLHPDVYEPSIDVRSELGIPAGEPYVIARFNGWGAYHDVGQSGFTADQRRTLLSRLGDEATVLVSAEAEDSLNLPDGARPFDLHPAHMHDALAEASLLVADTQTMVTEAALLGTPAIRSNSFVGDGDMGNFTALEAAGLIHNTRDFEAVSDLATELLTDERRRDAWNRRHAAYVSDLVNLTSIIVDVATAPDPRRALESKRTESVPLPG